MCSWFIAAVPIGDASLLRAAWLRQVSVEVGHISLGEERKRKTKLQRQECGQSNDGQMISRRRARAEAI